MKKQFILCGIAAASVAIAFASVDKLNFVKNNEVIKSIDINSIDHVSYRGTDNEFTHLDVTAKDASVTSYSLEGIDHIAYQHGLAADALDFTYQPSEEKVNSVVAELEIAFSQFLNAQVSLLGGKDGAPLQEHYYELVYNMTVDNYAGYFTVPNSSFMMGNMETTYSQTPTFTEGSYNRLLYMKNNLGGLLNRDEANSIVEIKAIALLMFNIVAQEVTDIYGAIPYIDHKSNKGTNPFTFNNGRDIYHSIVNNLDSINACLAHFPERPQWYQNKLYELLAKYDMCTLHRNFETWRRLANSLKLRMAMHIVKSDAATARKWAEEAVAAGVIEAKDQQVGVFGGTIFGSRRHCLHTIQTGWNDSRLNASWVSMLTSLQHPYINYLLGKNSNAIINTTTGSILEANSAIVGLRAGLRMEPSQQYFSNMRCAYSTLNFNDPYENALYMPFYILKWAEVDFHRAEGALRGWDMGGSAEFFYYRGIDNGDCSDVFEFPSGDYEKYLAAYKNREEAVPYTYVDPMDDANNIESVTKIGVKWNDADDNETKLEKILTQKYIANFPYSYEGWTDIRRTGYPKIFPVLNHTLGNDGSLAEGEIIRRIPLPFGNTQAGQDDVLNTGINALGGPDKIATRVFWNVDTPNF